MGDSATGAEPTISGARYTLAVLAMAWLTAFLDRAVIALLATGIKASLRISDVQIGVVQGATFAVIYVLVAIPIGWLADRANRRNILLFGVCFWSVATMACGLARTYPELILARMAMGLGEAASARPRSR